ncbi:hypothetical protein [Rhodococcus sp. NBC_00294]|uniref:hypothetical protein n=1 Tax=Rhodococcus sp. NBC_00294 TaxID=2976004 RepID=UPI002E2B54AA|nr:hypothetical protein [Rhodococcus sp. NBC_00294]
MVAASAVAVAVAFAGPAAADEVQPGLTTTLPQQPGLSTTAPAPTQQREFLPGYTPSPQVQQSQWRSYDDYQSGRQQSSTVPAVYYSAPPAQPAPQVGPPAPLAPPPVPTVERKVIAPIDIPEGYIGVGGEIVPYDPNVVDPNLVEQFNNTSQALQADGGNFLVDAGFADAPRADRISAGVATGIVAGGTAGFLTSLVPATVITATGAGLGGALGVAATTGSGAIVWGGPVGWVFIPGAAALAGGAAGAALSAPIVLGLTVTGAALGGLLGATVTGGEQQIITEPAPVPAPAPEAPARAAAAPVWTPPQDVQQVLDTAPAYVEQARQAVTDVTGGADVLGAVDTVIADNAPALEQGAAALNSALASFVPA